MIWYALALIAAAILFLWLANRQRRQAGLPAGRISYTDVGEWQPNHQALYDPKLGLAGKPDYLVYINGVPVPVEVKSGRTPTAPYDSHIIQLAAYCYLVEVTTGKVPPYGLLRYPKETFEIAYTPELRLELLELVGAIRTDSRRRTPPERSHDNARRCSGCGFRETCDQRLKL
ncbi:MAG: Dna2/Cas4 domain-containing protein [Anaerolineaceae bacterium]|nr:Dna2/Cas4 domain-containing protein [Anaerolineaceae bacterium]